MRTFGSPFRVGTKRGTIVCALVGPPRCAAQLGLLSDDEPSEEARALVELPSVWAYETVEDMERTARDVVGPDEPFGGRTRADMGASHWDSLARVVQRQGVDVEAAELRALPHDVELSDRVLARIGRGGTGTA